MRRGFWPRGNVSPGRPPRGGAENRAAPPPAREGMAFARTPAGRCSPPAAFRPISGKFRTDSCISSIPYFSTGKNRKTPQNKKRRTPSRTGAGVIETKGKGRHTAAFSFGAGNGDRTRVVCLGSRSVAITPYLRSGFMIAFFGGFVNRPARRKGGAKIIPPAVEAAGGDHFISLSEISDGSDYFTLRNATAPAAARETTAATRATLTMSLEPVFGMSLPLLVGVSTSAGSEVSGSSTATSSSVSETM